MFFVHTGKRVVSYNSGRLPGAARVVYTTRANRIPSICNVADQPVDQTKRLDYLKISLRPPLPNKMKTGKRGIVTLDRAENIKRSQLERATRYPSFKGNPSNGLETLPDCPRFEGNYNNSAEIPVSTAARVAVNDKLLITIAFAFPRRVITGDDPNCNPNSPRYLAN